MCGIAGLLGPGASDPDVVARMTGRLEHRGPDDVGQWTGQGAGIVFGHRRLAVVDLTAAGHEPMISASGRLVVTFNGEIYNHAELRARLEEEGRAPEGGWRGHSDIETFLEAIDHWGLEQALDRAVGMFAFALWDRKHRRLHLVRDRFGEKPLYYGWVGKDLLFASELKAIRTHPDFSGEIDREAVAAFASRGYIPAPRSVYHRIFKLMPACILTVDGGSVPAPLDEAPALGSSSQGLSLKAYWSYLDVVRDGASDPFASEEEALATVEAALVRAISGQSLADVPIGAFLSGGIDSSTVTALYQKHSNVPVRTFSIGFAEDRFNEAHDAKRVAEHLGTVHHEHYVSVAEARDVIPLLPEMYDEPFADSSQIPTFLVSRFARGEVTVALTGDGGDELFGGYNRHVMVPRLWRNLRRLPAPVRALAGGPLAAIPPAVWARLGASRGTPEFGRKAQKALRIASRSRALEDVMTAFLDEWNFRDRPVRGSTGGEFPVSLPFDEHVSDERRLMAYDALTYLPDDILCKVDRASMAVSLETRVPFLDHRLAAVAARVPVAMNFAGGRGKMLLRKLLYRHVPQSLVDRPKAGFGVPIGDWLRGDLRPWAENLLAPTALDESGLFDAGVVSARWRDHLSGREDSTHALWPILMFEAWRRQTA
ncbi:MAG: asparagine synthase (glutamine-hydrolyzing) [Sphingomicrobium sp.]